MKICRSLAPACSIVTACLTFSDAVVGADADPANDRTLGDVVVTGTRVPGRTAIDSPVPIDVLGSEDVRRSAAIPGELGEALTHFGPTDEHITDGENFLLAADRGFKLARDGYLNLTTEFHDRNSTNRAGDSAFTDFNSMFNAGIRLSASTNLYSFGSLSYREAEGLNFFRYPDNSSNVQVNFHTMSSHR